MQRSGNTKFINLKKLDSLRYTYDKNYGNALEIYLTLRHKDVFQLIHKHNLFSSIKDKIVLLMDFDSEKAVDMLLDNEDKISIKKVVEELEDRPELQHVYLHKLFKRDHHKGQAYHEKQISLYAEYDRPNLLPFLRDSIHCPLEKVIIERRGHLKWQVLGIFKNAGQTYAELIDIPQSSRRPEFRL
ncbi:hypothetical protein CB1_000803028 [Camelus ferus]|nr:hypothetical protein CB1_000803028 [Camelus ferus]